MRSDYDISNIMYGAETAAELDFYRGEPKPRLAALLLDTVMQGRPTASKCRLLQMPSEILAKIISFVAEDKKALQQLALVNSDCCGLSRACQFSDFTLDYSRNKVRLLLELVKHIVAGRAGPGISDCIRKFTFKPYPYQVRAIHDEVWLMFREDPRGDYEYQGAAQVDKEATSIFSQTQRAVVLNFKAMRNLETLVWSCNFPLDKNTFSLFASSTAHTLMMNRTIIAQEFSLRPPLTPPSWPLRSLILINVRLAGSWDQKNNNLRDGQQKRRNPSNNFFKALFQLCSPTLESLHRETWNARSWKPLSLRTNSKSFPKLQQLRIKPGPDAIDEASLASFLSAPLKSLKLRHSAIRDFKDLISSHVEEPYQDLEELVVDSDENLHLITELIHKHNNLKKLWVTQSYYMSGRDTYFDRVLIPGLGKGRFNNLRSLYIQWGGQNKDSGRGDDHFVIMPECLAAICDLTSLEQLGLRCDERVPRFRSYEDYTEDTFPIWLIDHRNLQAHLQSLKNLKMLAIRGDAYPPRMNEIFGHNSYYRQDMANAEDFQTARDHPELAPFVQRRGDSKLYWEHAHLYRMLEYARSYRKVLPKLEWILCGRRPMKLVENDQGIVQPHPIGRRQDESKTFIGRVFGLATEIETAHEKD
ncbi:hypothetical protein IWW34DRAFT_788720 [Fusarium oxysporum f. sp. albedinis]|nr:hypothetical protein IWW34DRAFT_788720 [Fusarium oxysporum f. sp. albedinis]KAJ0152843.1 Uncharacterized protein HZ326_4738 [Fusarium oxysporum f. sp. albedinis]